MNYANLEQRMAHSYVDMFPPFVPLTDGEVSIPSQEQFYRFMQNVYRRIFDSPELLFTKIFEDDAFPRRFNKGSYGKPTLYNHMKRDLKEIDELLSLLFSLGQNSTVDNGTLRTPAAVDIKKKHRNVLPLLGLKLDNTILSCDTVDNLFPAWKWMATRVGATVLSFSRCMFDPDYPYMQDIYSTLFGNEKASEALLQHLQKRGYTRVEMKRGPYTLDYVKRNVENDVPLGSPLHGDPHHYGISAEYRPDVTIPQYLVLRILDMKNILLRFGRMSSSLQEFVVKHAKKCDECGYCTQTDKSGKRKPLCIDVFHKGEHRSICPLYPGFNFCFTALDEELAMNLVAFLDFMDKHITGES